MQLDNSEGGSFDGVNMDLSMSKLEKAEDEGIVIRGREPVGVVMWKGVVTDIHSCPSWRRRKQWRYAWDWCGRKSGGWRESMDQVTFNVSCKNKKC